MIFVTVGTHEQPFNRLIKKVDELKKNNLISEEVFMQIGYSTYEPQYCGWKKFVSSFEMQRYMEKADIVICHGGPSTFMEALSLGKRTIVVPRLKKFDEHVNDHQLFFSNQVKDKGYGIFVVKNIDQLGEIVRQKLSSNKNKKKSNNNYFVKMLEKEVNKLTNTGS